MGAQINILDEIIVDNFAGGGGAKITTMEQLEGRIAGLNGWERSTRMTRKRIIKLLMGRGCDRNSAKALAEFFWIMRITYKSAWTAIAWEGERNGWDY